MNRISWKQLRFVEQVLGLVTIPKLEVLKYKIALENRADSAKLIGHMLIEMREMTDNGQGQDNGLLIVEKIESLLNIGVQSLGVSKSKTARLSKLMKGKFDVYWLNKLLKLK